MSKKANPSKYSDALKWPTTEGGARSKKKGKFDHPFRSKLVDRDSSPPPNDITRFEDRELAACLNQASILPDDYDAYTRINKEERRD